MSPRLSDLLLSSQSDERLVSLARAGHQRAFAVIVERYRPELQAMARRLCSDGRSEDVVQQAFLSAFAALRSGCEVRHLRGWLYQILRNAAGRSEPATFVPLDGTTASGNVVEDIVQQRALAMSALSEIARLPSRQREAMIGTALDGRPRAEIASSMGLSEGAVRQLVHRARATLRGAVTAITPWPLVRWIAAASPDAPGPAELAAGAGAASSGGLALKLGALLASGTFLTGAAVHLQERPAHHGNLRAATSVRGHRAVARAHTVAVASVASPLLARQSTSEFRSIVASHALSHPVAHVGAPPRTVRHDRHEGGPPGPASRSDGPRTGGHDDGRGDRTGSRGSRETGGGDGAGSDGHGQDSGPSSRTGADRTGSKGTSTSGHDGSGGNSGSGIGSGDGATQMASAPQALNLGVDGSGSRHGSGSGSDSVHGSVSSDGRVSGSSGGGLSGSGDGSDGGGTSGG